MRFRSFIASHLVCILLVTVGQMSLRADDVASATTADELRDKANRRIASREPGTEAWYFALKHLADVEASRNLPAAISAIVRAREAASDLGLTEQLGICLMQESHYRLLAEGKPASIEPFDTAMQLDHETFSVETRSRYFVHRMMRAQYLERPVALERLKQEMSQLDLDTFEHRFRLVYSAALADKPIPNATPETFQQLRDLCNNETTLLHIDYAEWWSRFKLEPGRDWLPELNQLLERSRHLKVNAMTARLALQINRQLCRSGEFENAVTYCDEATKLTRKTGSLCGLAEAYTVKAETLALFDAAQAEDAVRTALSIAEQAQVPSLLESARLVALKLAITAGKDDEIRNLANGIARANPSLTGRTNNVNAGSNASAETELNQEQLFAAEPQSESQPASTGSNASWWVWVGAGIAASILALAALIFWSGRQQLRSVEHRLKSEQKTNQQNQRLRERLERKIAQSERVESLGVLAGGIAHDFNNLLMGVMANAEALRSAPPESDMHEKCIDGILQSAEVAAELSHKMLSYAGRQPTQRVSTDLNELVEGMVPLVNSAFGFAHDVTFTSHTNSAFAEIDVAQIEQVLLNLMTNAVNAIDSEGTIAISVGRETIVDRDADHIFGKRNHGGSFVYFEVADTGGGIPEGEIPQIFEPFFSGNKSGRGLGLAVVFGNVNRHDGLIRCTSAPGSGTCFRILLPSTNQAPTPAPKKTTLERLPDDLRIVAIDDQRGILDSIDSMLATTKWDRVLFESAEEALVHIEQDPESVDIVLLDVVMPRMGGIEFLNELNQSDLDVLVIIMSGYSKATHDELSQQYQGVQAFLAKPFSRHDLYTAVETCLIYQRKSSGENA